MLDKLKGLNTDRLDIDDVVAYLAFANSVKVEFEKHELEVPDWLTETIDALKTEVKARRRDNLMRALKAAEAKAAGLRSPEQKRRDAQADIKRIKEALAK